jgi:hypothetical protein
MTLDILAALEATPARGAKRCDLAAFLDSIPADTPGRDELIRLVETVHDRTADPYTLSGQRMAVVLTNLGHTITQNPVLDHRNRACRCYRG